MMTEDQFEHSFDCPVCGATTSVMIDRADEDYHRVEDCNVCCNPIEIRYHLAGGKLEDFSAEPAQ